MAFDDDRRLPAGFLTPGRLEAFSDGVFAIAITLLVLELDVPTGTATFGGELIAEWPSFLGYFVSFAFIGSVWVAHATLSRFLTAVDQVLLGLNLLLLLLVSLLPFTTKLMATHLADEGEHAAVVIFGLNLTLAAMLVNALFHYASRTPGLADASGDQALQDFERHRRLVVVVQAIATVIGVLAPTLAVAAYLLISLLVLLDPIFRATRMRRRARLAGQSPP